MAISRLELISSLERIAPLDSQEDWDNSGIQVDPGLKEINKILIALDLNSRILEEAVDLGVNLIIVHHPLIFDPIKRVDWSDITGKILVDLIKNNIGVYASHTPFDKAKKGNNIYMAEILDLVSIKFFSDGIEEDKLGIIGDLKNPISLLELANKLALGLVERVSSFRFTGNEKKIIKRIGIISGGGSSYIEKAVLNGCDLLITGDIKYHDASLARELGIALLDPGHFASEKSFAENMGRQLKEILDGRVEIIISKAMENPFWTIK